MIDWVLVLVYINVFLINIVLIFIIKFFIKMFFIIKGSLVFVWKEFGVGVFFVCLEYCILVLCILIWIVIYLRLFFDRIKLNIIYGIFKNFIKFCVVILKFEINLI